MVSEDVSADFLAVFLILLLLLSHMNEYGTDVIDNVVHIVSYKKIEKHS